MSYAALAVIFLVPGMVLLAVAARVARPGRRWWVCTGAVAVLLLVLTAVFDSLMVAADLFRYDESSLIGLRVLLVPVEDFAWPLASVTLLPALWLLLGRRHPGEAR